MIEGAQTSIHRVVEPLSVEHAAAAVMRAAEDIQYDRQTFQRFPKR